MGRGASETSAAVDVVQLRRRLRYSHWHLLEEIGKAEALGFEPSASVLNERSGDSLSETVKRLQQLADEGLIAGGGEGAPWSLTGQGQQALQAHNPSPRQLQFVAPWRDLRSRLARGIEELRRLHRESSGNQEERRRLAVKLTALEDALIIYEGLNERLAQNHDYAGAWRSFTAALQENVAKSKDAAQHSGFNVALSYQQGYGAEIDAPIERIGPSS